MRRNVPVRKPANAKTLMARFKSVAPICASLLLLQALGCAGAGQYVWYGEMPPAERGGNAGDYVIGVGDTISIRVYEQEGVSGDVKIRSDGKIALPLAGEMVVAGKRPLELSHEIEARLKEFIVSPRVTVNVTTSQPISVTMVGEVTKVGTVTLEPPARLVEALAQSGGPGEFADRSKIFVLRQFPAYRRIRFTWDAILHNEDGAASFPLRTGDVIVLE
jgi:polysaccharide biosynthesis/export protein